MDIRKYFGKSEGKSALSEIRRRGATPVRNEQKNMKPRPRPSKIDALDIISDSDGDGENPWPRSLQKKLKKGRRNKKVIISSDEEDLPPSASKCHLQKSSPGISPTKVIPALKPARSPVKRHYSEEEDSEEGSSFVPAPSQNKRKLKIPPGQMTINFNALSQSKKPSTKKTKDGHLKQINPAEFFNSFGKTTEETAEERESRELIRKEIDRTALQSVKRGEPKRGPKILTPEVIPNKNLSRSITTSYSHENISRASSNCDGSPILRSPKISPKKGELKTTKMDIASMIDEILISSDEEFASTSKRPPKKYGGKRNDAVVEEIVKTSKNEDKKEEKRLQTQARKRKNAEKIDAKDLAVSHGNKFETLRAKPKNTVNEAKQLDKCHPSPRKKRKDTTDRKTKEDAGSKGVEIPQKPITDTKNLPWVDKYKPTNLKHLVGQNGEKSPMNKLLAWLRDWPKYHLGEAGKQKKPRPPPWLAQNDGTSFKAVLLSGPPGVGKTTCAVMACQECNLQYIEMNASDVRNKKALESSAFEMLRSRQMEEFFDTSAAKMPSQEAHRTDRISHVLIMDEVDGMSGNEDRAGLAELIQMIKATQIPIICICNDRQSPKMRALVNYCFDLRFHRPRVEQIRARMLTIICQEHLKLSNDALDEIIETSQHDVRQSIYNLQLLGGTWSSKDAQRKDVAVSAFDAARRLLSANTSFFEKQQMFFVEYSLIPLFVQENYPNVQDSNASMREKLISMSKAACSISTGDIIDRIIRNTGAWSLLNEQALFSCILPSFYLNGYLKAMINFPSWLGKNSNVNKRKRLLRQLTMHTYHKTMANNSAMIINYVPVFRDRLCCPLVEKESNGVREVVDFYKEYDLIRDDSDAIAELATWPEIKNPFATIQTKVKAALTRALNREHYTLPYVVGTVTKGSRRKEEQIEAELDEEGNLVNTDGKDHLNDESDDGNNDDDDNIPNVIAKKTEGEKRGGATQSRGAARGGRAKEKRGPGARKNA